MGAPRGSARPAGDDPRAPRLVPASFEARPNRFIVHARLASGDRVAAHLADPGRLSELLVPGATLRLRPASGGSRRTAYSVVLVHTPGRAGVWVSVEPVRANRLAEELLDRGAVRGLGRGWSMHREVRSGRSRFDFLLERSERERLWVEVKSVTLVENEVGLFPDAPTARGRRHVEELTQRVQVGDRALVLFVVQRGDARRVRPHRGIDPLFAAALKRARSAGVSLRAAGYRLDAGGGARLLGFLPVRV